MPSKKTLFRLKTAAFFTFLFQPLISFAGDGTCESVQSGLWSQSSTWINCGNVSGIPQDNNFVIARAGHEITLDMNTGTINDFVLETGSRLIVANDINGITMTTNEGGVNLSLGELELLGDFTVEELNSDGVILGAVDGAFDLTINSNGTTTFAGSIGVTTPLYSLTTDAAGDVAVFDLAASSNFSFNFNGDTATSFNDSIIIGPNAVWTINQTGAGDIVFNSMTQNSGGPKTLIVNDVSGKTIFNGDIAIGELFTNDGSGNDVTVINTSSINTNKGGSTSGLMTFNDPVEIMQDVTFSKTGAEDGAIIFNNSINQGDGAVSSDVTLISNTETILHAVGDNVPITNLSSDAGGSVQLNDMVVVTNSVTFDDMITLSSDAGIDANATILNAELNLNAFDFTFRGSDVSANAAISGSGSLTSELTAFLNLNTENTYTGKTTILNGDLSLASAPSQNNISASSEIYLAEGSILFPSASNFNFSLADQQILSGDGTVLVSLTAESGSTINPGSSPGSLTLNTLRMDTGSSYLVELDGLTAQSEYDQLAVGSDVFLDNDSMGGTTLTVIQNVFLDNADQFIIIKNTSNNAVSGTFNGLAEGATVTSNLGSEFSITYAGGDGNDVVLTATAVVNCYSTYSVTDAADSGEGTLRFAVDNACDDAMIDFSGDLNITLSSEITIDKSINIDGSGHQVNISGNNSTRIFNVQSTGVLTMTTLDILDGFSVDEGGAILNQGTLNITDSTFEDNVSTDANLAGGAIYNDAGAELTITGSTFIGNQGGKGGAIFNQNGTPEAMLTISNSTFTANGSNTQQGGAIHNRGIFTSINNTIAGNGNNATIGGGVFTWNGEVALINTIVANNSGLSDCEFTDGNSTQNNSNSLITTGNCDAALTDDPLLLGLSDNGGNTQTMALSLTSPAVDAGDDAQCTSVDQRGVARPQLTGCDIGAYETESLGIIHVKQTTNNHAKQTKGACLMGACWDNAYSNLQDALEVAEATAQVWVAEGVYYPDEGSEVSDDDRSESFNLNADVAIYGGFVGTETALDQRDPSSNITILSGDIDQNDENSDGNHIAETTADLSGSNAYSVINVSGDGVILDGFVITAGNANGGGNPTTFNGGGIFCFPTTLNNRVFSQLELSGNHASSFGGAMYQCSAELNNSTLSGNQAGDVGGAIYDTLANTKLTDVSLINNSSIFFAGAILADNLILNRVELLGNHSGGSAGAVAANGFSNIANTLFAGNHAGIDAGGMYSDGPATFYNVTFTGNVANIGSGGALYVPPAKNKVLGEFISMYNTIVWNNQDASGTGTITAGFSGDVSAYFEHTLFQASGGSTSWDNSLGTDGGNNIDLDPEFVADFDVNSAPTITGNARLNLSSPAVETGNNNTINGNLDLDNNDRIQGNQVDMGAYEYSDLIFANGFE